MPLKNILITGTGSGLGHSLNTILGGDSYCRIKGPQFYQSNNYDAIIHCAVNTQSVLSHNSIDEFFQSNLNLLHQIRSIPHQHFIYISSIDVYPKETRKCHEEVSINANDIFGAYGIMKFYAEAIVKQYCNRPLILRPSALLGPSMRPNSLVKILSGKTIKLGLNEKSSFNYIRHRDIADFIRKSIQYQTEGIYNLCSTTNITLEEITNHFSQKIEFGEFTYATPKLDNSKMASLKYIKPVSSLQTVVSFWDDYHTDFSDK
ncbi:NAD-dependent epimerase/dehydratase family protein [Kiloniella litopenaei]|uniref:NAD-dependent epimerase/dehydratase family protein n=1 Tax=Kiloniella litopenaei TaxID=1549748 RepID=UPI003BAB44DF